MGDEGAGPARRRRGGVAPQPQPQGPRAKERREARNRATATSEKGADLYVTNLGVWESADGEPKANGARARQGDNVGILFGPVRTEASMADGRKYLGRAAEQRGGNAERRATAYDPDHPDLPVPATAYLSIVGVWEDVPRLAPEGQARRGVFRRKPRRGEPSAEDTCMYVCSVLPLAPWGAHAEGGREGLGKEAQRRD